MTITPVLRASARSAYRDVWRAASVTFRGMSSANYALEASTEPESRRRARTARYALAAPGSPAPVVYNISAFREKMRNDALTASQTAKDAGSYEQYTSLFREIATVLRHNIVQASKVREEAGQDIYRKSLTKSLQVLSS